jgi:hypothetical protein
LKTFFLLFILGPATLHAQFSLRTGIASHNDYFLAPARGMANVPYCHYFQPFISADYCYERWHPNVGLTWLHDSRHLEADYSTYNYGSHGGPGKTYGDQRQADAEFSYIGVRLGVDHALVHGSKFRLLLAISEHFDVLVDESYSNRYQTTWVYYSGDPPFVPPQFYTPPGYLEEPETKSGDFEVLQLDKLYCYTNVGLKPSVRIGAFRIEAEFLLSFFTTPRVVNKMVSNSYSPSGYTSQVGATNFSNEVSLNVTYTFSESAKLREK